MSTTSTIGVAIIAHNEASFIGRLLTTLMDAKCVETGRKIFDQVVVVTQTTTTDTTAAIARELGAEVYEDFVWIDDFAAKRRYAFSKLTTDWTFWADCDDQFIGLENARKIIGDHERDKPEVSAIWCQYLYDTDEASGNTIAAHQRERFVRRNAGWNWVRPVHEHQLGPPDAKLSLTTEFTVVHKRDRALDAARNTRNIRILRKCLKQDKNDRRAYFDLGSQYYHTLRWARALAMYGHFLRLEGSGPLERYQAMHRCADAWRALQRPDKAADLEWQAARLRPEWKDAWYGLAECAGMVGQWQMALNYSSLADPEKFAAYAKPLGLPDQVLVLNPLDYTFLPLLPVHRALGMTGRFPEALQIVTNGATMVPQHPEIKAALEGYTRWTRDKDAVDATLALARVVPTDNEKVRLFRELPPQLKSNKEVRDALVAPVVLKGADADVTIYCGPSLEDWGPWSPDETGIGGSETAVIQVARHLALKGLKVTVYNQCGAQEGDYYATCHVKYVDFSRFDATKPTKLFVAWRAPAHGALRPPCDQAWLWFHDCNVGPNLKAGDVAAFDLIRPVSRWHAGHLAWLYPFMVGKLRATRNGVDLARFENRGIERLPHRVLWTSSADRGLPNLLGMWPEVRQRVPDATLQIAYGWGNIDKLIMQGNQQYAQFKQQCLTLGNQPGVEWVGRLTQPKLAEAFQQASVLAYPTAFLETGFISGMEAMAGGCAVLSTQCGAIPETCGDAAILINGHATSAIYRQVFLGHLVALLTGGKMTSGRLAVEELRERGYAQVKGFGWDGVAEEWIEVMNEGKKEGAA